MRIAYDESSRGLMIAFGDPDAYSESQEVAPGVVVDFDKKGRPLAIELEDAAAVTDTTSLMSLVAPFIRSGADLRTFRDSMGMTQQELGEALGVPRNTIARWERDDMPIEKPQLLSLALRGLVAGATSTNREDMASPRAAKKLASHQGPIVHDALSTGAKIRDAIIFRHAATSRIVNKKEARPATTKRRDAPTKKR
jgi:transcriptional regulator with XRE-family HTH domain/uncharacterized protein YuzE